MYSASSQFVCYFISIPFFSCGCAREHRLCRMECNQNETLKCNAHFTNLQKRHFLRFRNRSVKHLNIRIIICTLIVDYIYTYYINAMLCWEREEEKKLRSNCTFICVTKTKTAKTNRFAEWSRRWKKNHTQNHTQFDSFLLLHFNIIASFSFHPNGCLFLICIFCTINICFYISFEFVRFRTHSLSLSLTLPLTALRSMCECYF